MSERKLNLGCGVHKLVGYDNIDISDGRNAYPLDYVKDDSCDEIRASHLLEHFGFEKTHAVLKDWVAKLRPGGVLKIAVPDFKEIAKGYLQCEKQDTQKYLMGGHCDERDYHKAIFDESSLKQLMESVGLSDIKYWNDYHDSCSLKISLNLCGTKTGLVNTEKLDLDEWPLKISAVMSMPRLAFTDNVFTAHKAFLPLGINIEKGTGVFWDQILTRMIEKHLDGDYVITLDYDSFFAKEHVIRLCQLMQENPDVDAIVPVQVKREGDSTLYGMTPEQMRSSGELVPITTGHFGLTIFRCESLRRLSRPWFMGVPNKYGRWEEERLDPDIFFWHKFANEGMKVCLAKDVSIGHLQLMCTYADTEDNGFKPLHRHMNDVNAGQAIPDHCIPKVVRK